MQLRKKVFPNVWCAPGALNFFGEGWSYHRLLTLLGRLLPWLRIPFEKLGFVSKTTTLLDRAGNMPLEPDGVTPMERFPKSIQLYPFSGHTLNAVGLSGPGAPYLLDQGKWQKRVDPFMISFMTVAQTKAERIEELRRFVELLLRHLPGFNPDTVALQLNFACPNTGHDLEERYAELQDMLDIAASLDIPIVVNFNPVVPTDVILIAERHPACDAIWIGNTVPWGTPGIEWKRFNRLKRRLQRRPAASPLRHRGISVDGALSGPACLPLTIKKVEEARRAGVKKPIIAGNGIQKWQDLYLLWEAGASGVALGIVFMLRPWRGRRLIEAAEKQFQNPLY